MAVKWCQTVIRGWSPRGCINICVVFLLFSSASDNTMFRSPVSSVKVRTWCIFSYSLFVFVCLIDWLCVCVFVYTQVTSERLWDGVQLWSLVWGEGGGWGRPNPPSASVTSSSSQALWAHAFYTTFFFRFNSVSAWVSVKKPDEWSSWSCKNHPSVGDTDKPDQWAVILQL